MQVGRKRLHFVALAEISFGFSHFFPAAAAAFAIAFPAATFTRQAVLKGYLRGAERGKGWGSRRRGGVEKESYMWSAAQAKHIIASARRPFSLPLHLAAMSLQPRKEGISNVYVSASPSFYTPRHPLPASIYASWSYSLFFCFRLLCCIVAGLMQNSRRIVMQIVANYTAQPICLNESNEMAHTPTHRYTVTHTKRYTYRPTITWKVLNNYPDLLVSGIGNGSCEYKEFIKK